MDIDKEIAALTREFAGLMQADRSRAEYGNLTILNLHLLAFMYFRETPPTMREIAAAASVSLPSASVMIDRLENESLVTRAHSKTDRRIVQVSLTSKGQRIIEQQVHKSGRVLKKALAGQTEANKRVVLDFFKSYIQAIREEQL